MTETVSAPPPMLLLVTGPSGAGRSTAVNALEDIGFEVIDNLPLSLLPRLIDGPLTRPLALGLDVRNRDFSTSGLMQCRRTNCAPRWDACLALAMASAWAFRYSRFPTSAVCREDWTLFWIADFCVIPIGMRRCGQ